MWTENVKHLEKSGNMTREEYFKKIQGGDQKVQGEIKSMEREAKGGKRIQRNGGGLNYIHPNKCEGDIKKKSIIIIIDNIANIKM